MNPPSTTIADILARLEQEQIKFIDLQFTDVVGVVKMSPFQPMNCLKR